MNTSSPERTQLFKVSEVAKEIGRSGQTIKRWRDKNVIPQGRKVKSSGHIVFTADEVEEIKKFATATDEDDKT